MAGETTPTLAVPGGGNSGLLGFGGLGQDAAGLSSMFNLLFGTPAKNTTENIGGSTETVQNVVDPAAINKTVQDMLEGNGTTSGLAALMTGAKSTGGYNSSTTALLGNDLVARIAGEVAKITATKTTTKSGSQNTSSTSTDANKAAQAAALAALMKSMVGGSKSSGGGGGGGTPATKDKPTTDPLSPNGEFGVNKNSGQNDLANRSDNDNIVGALDEVLNPSAQPDVLGNLQDSLGGTPDITIGDITPVGDIGSSDIPAPGDSPGYGSSDIPAPGDGSSDNPPADPTDPGTGGGGGGYIDDQGF